MTEYKSEAKVVLYPIEDIFAVLSDLQKLDLVKDKIKDFSYDKDSCSLNVSPIGNIKFVITERSPYNTIKFKAKQLPFDVNLIINITKDPENNSNSELELVVNANLNPFLKPMVSKPLQEGLNKAADMLASLPYSDIAGE